MFQRVASDVLGLSDIGSIIKPENYNQVESDDYIFHEDEEKIYFLIKSKSDEYCFTNYALIHLDGTSATSKKRLLKRFDYKSHPISDVRLETAGTVDLDIEIKFNIGGHSYSIDVQKNQIEQLKDLYKALIKIGSIQRENGILFNYAENSLKTAVSAVSRYSGSSSPQEEIKAINKYAFEWMKSAHNSYVRKDFGEVFEKYIAN
jgi:hypothetical protein